MRRGGTPMSRASRLWLKPIGLRKSSSRISPGCGFGSRSASSVVVDDLDVMGVALSPNEADPPLVVDPDAVLARPVRRQRLQPVAGRHREVGQPPRLVEVAELPPRGRLDLEREAPRALAAPDPLGLASPERADHTAS